MRVNRAGKREKHIFCQIILQVLQRMCYNLLKSWFLGGYYENNAAQCRITTM